MSNANYKTGLPVIFTTSNGEHLKLVPQWSLQEGAWLDLRTDHPVTMRLEDFETLASFAEKLLRDNEALWTYDIAEPTPPEPDSAQFEARIDETLKLLHLNTWGRKDKDCAEDRLTVDDDMEDEAA